VQAPSFDQVDVNPHPRVMAPQPFRCGHTETLVSMVRIRSSTQKRGSRDRHSITRIEIRPNSSRIGDVNDVPAPFSSGVALWVATMMVPACLGGAVGTGRRQRGLFLRWLRDPRRTWKRSEMYLSVTGERHSFTGRRRAPFRPSSNMAFSAVGSSRREESHMSLMGTGAPVRRTISLATSASDSFLTGA